MRRVRPKLNNTHVIRLSHLFRIGAKILVALFLTVLVPAQSSSSVAQSRSTGSQDLSGAQALRDRLLKVNHDTATRGLHDFAGSSEKLLTGYAARLVHL
jgi:hypothetical protein